MSRCSTCRWWQRWWGEGGLKVNPKDYGECIITSDGEIRKEHEEKLGELPKSLARASGNGWEVDGASLITDESFGCVQWARDVGGGIGRLASSGRAAKPERDGERCAHWVHGGRRCKLQAGHEHPCEVDPLPEEPQSFDGALEQLRELVAGCDPGRVEAMRLRLLEIGREIIQSVGTESGDPLQCARYDAGEFESPREDDREAPAFWPRSSVLRSPVKGKRYAWNSFFLEGVPEVGDEITHGGLRYRINELHHLGARGFYQVIGTFLHVAER